VYPAGSGENSPENDAAGPVGAAVGDARADRPEFTASGFGWFSGLHLLTRLGESKPAIVARTVTAREKTETRAT